MKTLFHCFCVEGEGTILFGGNYFLEERERQLVFVFFWGEGERTMHFS